jgi:hypothetical protein
MILHAVLRRTMLGQINLRLVIALAPALLLGGTAVVVADRVVEPGLRFALLFTTVICIAMMAWRVGAAAMGGSLTRAHGLPQRLSAIAGAAKHPPVDRRTGLHAEWYFRLRVDEEVARAARHGRPFTLVVISPRKGSRVDVSSITLDGLVRQLDFAGIVTGSLLVCLPNTERGSAWHVIDRVTALIQQLDVRVVEYPRDGPSLNALLANAAAISSQQQQAA